MKVAFVNPPKLYGHFLQAEDCCWGITPEANLPGGLLSCASQMEDAFFFDLGLESPEKLASLKPDLIVYPTFVRFALEIHTKMAKVCKDIPKITIALPPGYMEDFAKLEPNPFCVVYSEPEKVFSALEGDLVEWRSGSRGTAWMDDEVFHKTAPLRGCLHEIKGTDWSLIPPRYWPHYWQAVYQISRGCPWRCHFCVWGGSTVTDRTFRMRPAEQVATDLINLRDTANRYRDTNNTIAPIKLYTLSAQLTTSIKWIRAFHSLMKDRPYPFKGNVNLRELTPENIRLLNKSGMTTTSAGAEALTDPLLKKLNKGQSFEDIIRGIKILNQAGAGAWYIIHLKNGFGETKKDIAETLANIKVMKERGIKHSRFHIGTPILYYKGTVMAERPPKTLVFDHRFGAFRQKNILIDDWLKVKAKLLELNLANPNDPHHPIERLDRVLVRKRIP